MISVFGIGNPLMDFISYKGYEFVEKLNTQRGTMNLISKEKKQEILNSLSEYKNVPGGSCANTLRGLAWLGSVSPIDSPLYSGAVGKDDVGVKYGNQMKDMGLITNLGNGNKETGVSVIIVTPDYERTMFTYLGACQEYKESDVDLENIKNAQILHITGYMWDTESQKNGVRKAIETAKDAGVKVSFDIADPFVVQRHKDDFISWMPGTIDILFGNEEEISTIIGKDAKEMEYEDIIREAGYLSPLVIMKVGAKGCYVNEKGKISHIQGVKAKVVDTIGAGDFFASGFLFGLIKSKTPQVSASLANNLAAKIVEVEGCDLQKLNPGKILQALDI